MRGAAGGKRRADRPVRNPPKKSYRVPLNIFPAPIQAVCDACCSSIVSRACEPQPDADGRFTGLADDREEGAALADRNVALNAAQVKAAGGTATVRSRSLIG